LNFLRGRPFLLALIFIGVALRVVQYAANTSFWFDEFSLARNIVHRPLVQLALEPLAHHQVAPVGFVVVEKLVVGWFGSGDQALRLLPFLCGLASLVLFVLFAERVLTGYAVPFAVACFAIGVPFIRYSTEVKQYGLDVAATLALSLIAFRLRDADSTPRRCVLAGLAGAVLVWFSQASVLAMTGIGAALVLTWLLERDSRMRRAVLVTVPIWALASAAATLVAFRRMTPGTNRFMHDFWQSHDGFFPWPPKEASDGLWLWDRVMELLGGDFVRYRLPSLYCVLAILGLIVLWRRNRFAAWIVVGPFLVTVAAAVAQQYPFRTRVILFLVAGLVLLIAEAAEWLRRIAGRRHPAVGAVVMAVLLVSPFWAVVATPPPYWMEDYKSPLSFLEANRQKGDAVYVYTYAYEALERYGPEYGLRPGDYTVGGCWRDDFRAYLRDVDRYRGAPRVWIVTSGVPEFNEPGQNIRSYLATIGIVKGTLSVPSFLKRFAPVSVDLYDLSDPKRLAAASASSFPLKPPGNRRPLCLDFIGLGRPDSRAPDATRP
jgi:hypothetical protein